MVRLCHIDGGLDYWFLGCLCLLYVRIGYNFLDTLNHIQVLGFRDSVGIFLLSSLS